MQHNLIILDFSKAFDRVPHERFPKKLDHYSIRDSTQGWIKATDLEQDERKSDLL
jgi:hypothetical protein